MQIRAPVCAVVSDVFGGHFRVGDAGRGVTIPYVKARCWTRRVAGRIPVECGVDRRLCQAWCRRFPERASGASPAEIEAIVLIDEIDLHLHMSLQRNWCRRAQSPAAGPVDRLDALADDPDQLRPPRDRRLGPQRAHGLAGFGPADSRLDHRRGDQLADGDSGDQSGDGREVARGRAFGRRSRRMWLSCWKRRQRSMKRTLVAAWLR
jgi:hypothetical protein